MQSMLGEGAGVRVMGAGPDGGGGEGVWEGVGGQLVQDSGSGQSFGPEILKHFEPWCGKTQTGLLGDGYTKPDP